MSVIIFDTRLYTIGEWIILHLPESASRKLPSRGQTMIEGTINGVPFQTVLEPDGVGSHWFRVDKALSKNAKIEADDVVSLEIVSSDNWPNPEVPKDLKKALVSNKSIHQFWNALTPMAKWDWIRWINATKNEGTRQHRIEVALSKMKSGMKRPCCFNRTACTVMDVSHNGRLINPAKSL